MTAYGAVFRQLRLERGLSLQEVAGEELSVSQLSRFERGESDLSVSKFFSAVDRMGVEMADLVWQARDYQKSDEHAFMSQLTPLYYEQDIEGLQLLGEEELKKAEQVKDGARHRLNHILTRGLMAQLDASLTMTEEALAFVSDYLFQVEIWRRYELILLANLYTFYPTDYVYRMGRSLFEQKGVEQILGREKQLLRIAALNFYEHCLEQRELEKAQYFKEKAGSRISATAIFEKTIFLYLKGFEAYQRGHQASGLEQMQAAIQVFETVDAPEQVLYYEQKMARFVSY